MPECFHHSYILWFHFCKVTQNERKSFSHLRSNSPQLWEMASSSSSRREYPIKFSYRPISSLILLHMGVFNKWSLKSKLQKWKNQQNIDAIQWEKSDSLTIKITTRLLYAQQKVLESPPTTTTTSSFTATHGALWRTIYSWEIPEKSFHQQSEIHVLFRRVWETPPLPLM